MKYRIQTALEEIEGDFPNDAFQKFLYTVREIIVIVEEDNGTIHEYPITHIWADDSTPEPNKER